MTVFVKPFVVMIFRLICGVWAAWAKYWNLKAYLTISSLTRCLQNIPVTEANHRVLFCVFTHWCSVDLFVETAVFVCLLFIVLHPGIPLIMFQKVKWKKSKVVPVKLATSIKVSCRIKVCFAVQDTQIQCPMMTILLQTVVVLSSPVKLIFYKWKLDQPRF